MANSVKVTKLQVVERMLATESIVANAEFKAYLENEKALLEKKRDNKKATKTQTENVGIKALILEVLAEKSKQRVSDITKAVNDRMSTDYTSNKISSQVTVLKNDKAITREVEKKIAYFSLA